MRLFIAIDIPAEIKVAVERTTKAVRKTVGGSWVSSESFHLTLAFIGEQTEEVVEPLTAALVRAMAPHQPVICNLTAAGVFPAARRARVGWLGIAPDEPLQSIAESVRAALRVARVPHDDKPFRPHLTLVRFRQSPAPEQVTAFLQQLQTFDTEPFRIDHVTLYSSVLSPNGALHTALARVPLRGTSAGDPLDA